MRLGWLERSGPQYRLGAKLFELGSLVPHRLDLRESALPFLQDLFEATRETVHLGVREGMDVVYLERIHGHEALTLPSRIGGSLPLTCTGVGKALLAFSGPELTGEVLSRPLPSLTPYSITDPARLRMALEKIQVSGLAYEEQEAALGVSCIAAPVFAGGATVAALSWPCRAPASARPSRPPRCGRRRWACPASCAAGPERDHRRGGPGPDRPPHPCASEHRLVYRLGASRPGQASVPASGSGLNTG
ncbi:transcriptional regulator, IclR family [Actinobacteria bacterium OV320]|nr:transcriptional regulator, IclR family [Actinobacteria bacterium OV320]